MISRRRMMVGAGIVGAVGLGGYLTLRQDGYHDAVDSLWAHRPPGIGNDFEYLVHNATLAANSHNAQPWLFSGAPENISIRPDLSRALPAADPDNHHLYASLGCAAENLSLAAASIGKSAGIEFDPEGDGNVLVDLIPGPEKREELFDAIVDRQCTRSDYDGTPVPAADLKKLEDAAKTEGASVMLITDRQKMQAVSELMVAANSEQVSDPHFAEELKSWLRFNGDSALETGDGLYSACSGNPTLPTFLGEAMFELFFSVAGENEKYTKQLSSSSGLAVFVSQKDDREHWVKAGRSYQRFALQATALGIRHAFLNQAVDVERYRKELASLLGLGGARPDLLIRFGYCPPMPRSIRRPIASVIREA